MMRENYLNRGGKGADRFQKGRRAENFFPTIIRLFKYMRRDLWGLIFSMVIAGLSVILSVQAPKILGTATTVIFDGVTKSLKNHQAIRIDMAKVESILLYVLVIYLISFVSGVLQQSIMTRISQRTVYTLRREFKNKMKKLPISYYDSHNNGDIMSRMINDMDNISGTLNQTLIQLITSILQFVGTIYFMLTISWQLALVAFITVPLVMITVRIVAPLSQKFFSEQQKNLGLLNDQIEENYSGHTIIKTFNHEAAAEKEFARRNDEFYKSAWKAQFVSTLIYPTMRFINNLDYLAMAVIGGLKVISGSVNLGDVQAMLQYTNQFAQPITNISNMLNTIQATVASAERIFEVLDEKEMTEGITDIEKVTDSKKKRTDERPKNSVSNFETAERTDFIHFEQVAFSYNENQTLMTDVNFSVEVGQMVAIVGPTGAGKTTMINLLERFYDVSSGKILLEGKDIRETKREQLRSRMAMVLQETWLFSGTIMDNLRYGRLESTDDEVIQAAKMAHADEFITTLPQGYQTVLNETATNISHGQRQLLTIARAFVANPEILILDEATSSVDTRTERLIQSSMNRLLKGRTSFVVAHRLSTIRDANQILVMDKGNIVETGNHESLLKQEGLYASLYNSQFAK
ncbi:ABC transporter ATP-binding and permease protein [Lactococcus cremoris subsp. cremoris UC509.9]|uniref:ABC transporter ATP-binding protein n=1 Tax=Lactococcus lactis subsp. cremoris TaxID=1359 RepID=A0AAJ6N205_LACLC|nr:ABC transporter ATP-binding protein [Lactococcus cremoris]AFW90942.1 ABC transporter ATP-binding and permease protein [Lactococcus cremoris subsp. cremoris UC509.9]ARD90585.1 ABC transporter ATP-binding protein [Lactococcus cremoris]MRM68971.1 ATP-binding cassette domain-containing protein [Lactococcus cremoris]QJD19253.1 ABC transporter ATP-binding protein [Lactococcus cremoris]QRZ29084.1 ABC transporter ATP-binding and permease protein [Lactococcus cremoris]